jgi:hypothetical protein
MGEGGFSVGSVWKRQQLGSVLSSPFSAAAAALTYTIPERRATTFHINPDDVDSIFPSNRKAAGYTKEPRIVVVCVCVLFLGSAI